MLEKNEALFGYVAEGYWCDVGSLDSYREAQYDALNGRVSLDFAYQEMSPGIWMGQNVHVELDAKLHPPLLIGDNCRIGIRANIEPGSVIGDNVTVGADADLKRPILWNGVLIGEETHLQACTIARGARIDRRARVLEGAVVGALSNVGEEAQVSPGIRVWPSKHIEPGATLNINLIWGSTAPRNLFGQRGVSGLANIDITPEFAVKLGAAYASTLKPIAQVTISRDQRSISRMVSRSLVAGIMSVGVDVQNLEATAFPIARCVPRNTNAVGGVHVRIHPDRSDYILIEFFDEQGINISKAKEKKIEGAYFKEDFRRAPIGEIGSVNYPTGLLDDYARIFEKWLDTTVIRSGNFKVVIDYVYAVSGAVLPQLLSNFGCDAVVLNASLRNQGTSPEQREELLTQLGPVVEALKANFGVQVSANGEQFVLVDETGTVIRDEALTALMVEIILTANPRGTVVVPVHTSSAVEQIARRHDATVIRTKANPTALMETCRTDPTVVLGGNADTGFIFPQLHPGFDAMFSIAKLIEMLILQRKSLGQLKAGLPRIYHRIQTVRCPWTRKGALMRHLVETHPPELLELIDGVKIKDPSSDNWILILPDAGEPLVHIFANGGDREWVDTALRDYRQRVQDFTELDCDPDPESEKV